MGTTRRYVGVEVAAFHAIEMAEDYPDGPARLSSILLKNPVVAPALGILERCRLGGLPPLGLMWRRSAPDEG
jgi:hypothetical protein